MTNDEGWIRRSSFVLRPSSTMTGGKMGDLTRETTVNALRESIFKFAADPHNAPKYVSSIRRIISGPTGDPTLGQTWQAEANFLGRNVNVTVRLAELVESEVVRFVLEGEPRSIM